MAKKIPKKISVGGDQWDAVPMRVVQKDHMGRVLLLRVMHPGDTAELSEDADANHFIVPYVKKGSLG